MKVTVERAALLRSLGHVHRVVERRNTIPILSNILIRAEESSVRLKATDLDLEVTERFAADVEQAGATTIPAYMLYDIIRKLPDGAQVSLEMTGDTNTMVIRSGRSRFTLQTLPDSDFPDLAAGDIGHQFVPRGGFLHAVRDEFSTSLGREHFGERGVGAGEHDLGAFGGQPPHGACPDARGAPGDQRHLACKPSAHAYPPVIGGAMIGRRGGRATGILIWDGPIWPTPAVHPPRQSSRPLPAEARRNKS